MRAKLALFSSTLLLALGACATTRRHADDAFARRDFVEAAQLYDTALDEDPKDDKARAGRARAREAALTQLLEDAQQLRAQNRKPEARMRLARFFRLRRQWWMQTPTALVPALDREAVAATEDVERKVRPLLEAGAPLAAEEILAAESGVVDEPELTAARKRLRAQVGGVGARRCGELRASVTESTPYWGWLIARYCAHFGGEAPEGALPFSAGAIDIDGALVGAPGATGDVVAARLRKALVGTPWYAQGAPARMQARLEAHYGVSGRHAPVTLVVPWTERVAYTVVESRQVPHTVSYQVSETHYVQVPYQSLETQTYSCGSGTSFRMCTRSNSVTRYRSEPRTQYVTRQRTEYRTVHETVVRYRNVSREFTYVAERYENRYAVAGKLTVALPSGGEPVELSLDSSEMLDGLSHDVSFEPAGVEPRRAELPAPDVWLRAHLDGLLARVREDLGKAWKERMCQDAASGLEPAARCLYGRRPVATVAEGLLPTLVGDADAMATFAVKTPR